MKENLLKLQNGTDIRGILIDHEEKKANMTEDDIRAMAKGIVKWLSIKEKQKPHSIQIAVGMDSRITGPKMKQVLIEEIARQGVQVIDCKMATTPAMFMTTVMEDYRCNCGIMITASHLPFNYNGLKIFTSQGSAEKVDIRQILEYAVAEYENETESSITNAVKEAELIEDYARSIVYHIIQKTGMRTPFEGLKIIVDAGNGAGGFYAKKVLETLGADIKGSQFLEPDGMFPNHIPNPENEDAMAAISQAVLREGADLGIIFDTDVDRAAIVADDGTEINRNRLIALIADIILREHPGSVIVTDSITSDGLTDFIEKRGGVHHRFQRGYKNVINEALRINQEEENKSYLAIETSGHAALEENYFLDDGSYLVSKILIEVARMHQEGKKIQELLADLREPNESREYRLKISTADFANHAEEILEKIKKLAESQQWQIASPNYEGVKVRFPQGWFLLRKSLHEPVMPLNIEGQAEHAVDPVLSILKEFVKEQDGIQF